MSDPGGWAGAGSVVSDAVGSSVPGWVSDLGAPGLLAVIVLLILTDQLVVGRRLRKVERELEKEREASAVKDLTIRDLTDANKATASLLRALKGELEEGPAP